MEQVLAQARMLSTLPYLLSIKLHTVSRVPRPWEEVFLREGSSSSDKCLPLLLGSTAVQACPSQTVLILGNEASAIGSFLQSAIVVSLSLLSK